MIKHPDSEIKNLCEKYESQEIREKYDWKLIGESTKKFYQNFII